MITYRLIIGAIAHQIRLPVDIIEKHSATIGTTLATAEICVECLCCVAKGNRAFYAMAASSSYDPNIIIERKYDLFITSILSNQSEDHLRTAHSDLHFMNTASLKHPFYYECDYTLFT